MRNRIVLLLITLLPPTAVRAGAIQYDQIPSDVTGYAHFDLDPFFASQICQQMEYMKMQIAQWNAVFGPHVDMTMYVPKSGGPGGFVFLFHGGDQNVHQSLEARAASAKDAIVFTYGNQEVHYASEGWQQLMAEAFTAPLTRPQQTIDRSSEDTGKNTGQFTLGIGSEDGPSGKNLSNGPCFTAFVDKNLIVFAGDLPSMSNALDVIAGKKPSLATEDPQGLKMSPPPGVFGMGAGMTATYSKENADGTNGLTASTQLAKTRDAGGGFGLDMFGSFKGKARLGRFDMGEDDQNLYIDGLITMKDADAATQLKNLVVGIKALVSLTQTDAKPLIDPLDVQASDHSVTLHWSWPSANVSELIRLARAQGNHENANSATDATQPTH
jgi:hypothetical protein